MSEEYPIKLLAPAALCLLLTAVLAQADQRSIFSEQSPSWLTAVGTLEVPGTRSREGRRRHYLENCSGTLLASGSGREADIVLTAWHCLEFYDDLSRAIIFTLLPGTSRPLRREAYRVADGGGMHADWALLKLYQPVSAEDVQGLSPHPARADAAQPITMAGYSRDDGLGSGGTTLTYHSECRITHQQHRESESDCQAYKGASGGAVIQLTADGEPRVSGVISRGDSESVSIYVPVADFRGALNRFLN